MSRARACAGVVALAVGITTLEIPAAHAGPATGTPAANPTHPVWNSNKARAPEAEFRTPRSKTKQRPKAKQQLEDDQMREAPLLPHHTSPFLHQPDPTRNQTTPASPEPRLPEELDATIGLERHQRAEQAYQEAQRLVAASKYNEAVVQLDMATELDPAWSAPVALRAETFGKLAQRYSPSEALLSAQAADLQRLLALEPNVEVAQRSQQMIALRADSQDAQRKEARRRKMVKPALLVGSLGVALLVGGAFLAAGVYPSTDIDGFRQRSMVYGGIAMTAVGVAVAPVAISLGVLAGRQARRDQATRELNAYTGRPQPTLGLSPMGLSLQF